MCAARGSLQIRDAKVAKNRHLVLFESANIQLHCAILYLHFAQLVAVPYRMKGPYRR